MAPRLSSGKGAVHYSGLYGSAYFIHDAGLATPTKLGNATKSAVAQLLGDLGPKPDTLEKLPLRFHHGSRHFAHESLQLPRVDIDRDLPKQSSTCHDISLASLWLSGNWQAITLDGSPDERFERESRESAHELRGTLDKLKEH
ncbi:uncharacterized protein F5Z01DRAFT_634979 [Emericellopsis atlantica]|uniref:Uncharacterized protein n=1 Tax=Emericellopsis atlantica TaxID=2614577 RepID=A0A9P7ZQ29_9HYPO|nr:uncharacterized protein F5Z01DRAFT_634979 [Emericellopsis atlantica]KAG9256016.1 hypothetical protein F5Z01DRAFT_634979 [Emericellopsis atlantica]